MSVLPPELVAFLGTPTPPAWADAAADPGRLPLLLVDRLIVAAFIEARSCERFALIAPRLDAELRFHSGPPAVA